MSAHVQATSPTSFGPGGYSFDTKGSPTPETGTTQAQVAPQAPPAMYGPGVSSYPVPYPYQPVYMNYDHPQPGYSPVHLQQPQQQPQPPPHQQMPPQQPLSHQPHPQAPHHPQSMQVAPDHQSQQRQYAPQQHAPQQQHLQYQSQSPGSSDSVPYHQPVVPPVYGPLVVPAQGQPQNHYQPTQPDAYRRGSMERTSPINLPVLPQNSAYPNSTQYLSPNHPFQPSSAPARLPTDSVFHMTPEQNFTSYQHGFPSYADNGPYLKPDIDRHGIAAYPYRPKDPQLGKRTKVSRACDECRRKKTRCDVDAGRAVCSPCRRACVQCTYERAQLKRGPARKRPGQIFIYSPDPSGNMSLSTPSGPATHVAPNTMPDVGAGATTKKQPRGSYVARLTRSRSRSVSSAVSTSSTAVSDSLLPPIETLLSRRSSSASSQGAPPLPQGAELNVNEQPILNEHLNETSSSVQSKSGFPLLVEIACSQSESPHSEEGHAYLGVSPHSPPLVEGLKDPLHSPYSVADSFDKLSEGSVKHGQSKETEITPPPQYDSESFGIPHKVLMEYYSFVHPAFPLLPDQMADLDAVLHAAGPAKDYLVAALNYTGSDRSEYTVPFSLQKFKPGHSKNDVTKSPIMSNEVAMGTTHLTALLFMYMKTLDSSWLGAAVAACAALLKWSAHERVRDLAALVVAFDRIQGVITGLPSLVPTCFQKPAEQSQRIKMLLTLLRWEPAGDGLDELHVVKTPASTTLSILGNLSRHEISKDDADREFEQLLPQLFQTPLENILKTYQA